MNAGNGRGLAEANQVMRAQPGVPARRRYDKRLIKGGGSAGPSEGHTDMTTRGDDRLDRAEDEISLKPLFETLWASRWIIMGSVAGVAMIYVVGALIAILLAPVERLGSIQFRLLFEGADKGEYPNGTAFSASEIVAGPVLSEVFKTNDLQRFGTYENFKDSMFVLQSNLELDLLGYEYGARLADPKLSPIDRARIEAEFKNKREELVDPVYTLSMRRTERLKILPHDVVGKALVDTLATWAKQADERKGATKYNIDVLSPSILQRDMLEREDYLVAIDILRTKTARVLATIDQMAKLPGAKVVRLGPERKTLADLRSGLEDIIRFELEPLLGVIRSDGITKSARALSMYAGNQLFQLRLEQREAADRVAALQGSIREFSSQRGLTGGDTKTSPASPAGSAAGSTITPQLDQSFLDRMMLLSTARDDSEYKRKMTDRVIEESEKMAAVSREAAYYEDLVRELQRSPGKPAGYAEAVALIKTRTSAAFDEIVKGVEQTAAIYREISALNLNPSSTLYAQTGPFTERTERPLSPRTLALYLVLISVLTAILSSIYSLIRHAVRRRASGGAAS